MPSPESALILAELLTTTSTLIAVKGNVGVITPLGVGPRYPAAIPAGGLFVPVRMLPECIVPLAVTTIELLLAESGTFAASLTASIPTLPELMTSPGEVITDMFPVSLLKAKIPYFDV